MGYNFSDFFKKPEGPKYSALTPKVKILTIGDTHGRTPWKTIDFTEYKYVVFTGDYLDSFEYSDKKIYSALKEIIYIKSLNPKKVILLWGNHELPYLYYMTDMFKKLVGRGFRHNMAWKTKKLLEEHKHYFQAAFLYKNYLWTHAGISNAAWESYFKSMYDGRPIDLFLNELFRLENNSVFRVGVSRGGTSSFGSIFWADLEETRLDPLVNYHQIVGHTAIPTIYTSTVNNSSITYVDTNNEENYILEV